MAEVVFVSGATGTVGREVVRHLDAAGVAVRAGSRSPGKQEGNVTWVEFDPEHPEGFPAALAGSTRMFLMTAVVPDTVAQTQAMLDAARTAGIQHVVKLSAVGSDAEPAITFGHWHHQAEAAVAASRMSFTILRPNSFMQNFSNMYAATIRDHGAFYAPMGEGQMSYVDARDIGAVAAKALVEPGHEGQIYTLTGPEALSNGACAAILSRVLGRDIRYVDVPEEQACRSMLDAGMPEWLVKALLELFAVNKAGDNAAVTDTVAKVAGRPPISFEQYVKDNADAFQAKEAAAT